MQSADFTEALPFCLSEDIFLLLDVPSLCFASEVSAQWNHYINDSNYIWKTKYSNISSKIPDYKDLRASWWRKMTIEEYLKSQCRAAWFRGDFSKIGCYKDLRKCARFQPFTADEWGEIFQRELDR